MNYISGIFPGVFIGNYVVSLYNFHSAPMNHIYRVCESSTPGVLRINNKANNLFDCYGRSDRWRLATHEEIKWHLATGLKNITLIPKQKNYEIY